MRILLIQALEAAHVYSVFTRSLRRELRLAGVDAEIFDQLANPHSFGVRLVEGRYDAVVSFGSFAGGLVLDNGASVFDVVGSKFLGWQFDHPIYVEPHIANPMAGRVSVYPNANHLRFCRAAGLGGRAAVMLPGVDPPASPGKAFRQRSMEVFVAATWNGEPVRVWDPLEDSAAKRILSQVTDRLLADRETSLIDAYEAARDDLGYDGLALGPDLFDLLRASLTYVRHLDRFNAVQALARSGLPLTVCGSGWEAALGERPNVTVLPSRAFADTPGLYADAKLSINLNAGNGGCERVGSAMLSGSCVASEYSGALSAIFDAHEIATFERSGPRGIAEVAAGLLESGQAEDMAAAGQAKAEQAMLWSHRVAPVLALLADAGPPAA